MFATTCSRSPASRMPASTSSTSPSGPQSACPKKRAGNWEWSNPHSGRMRPHVPNLRDDRLCLGAGLQVVDVGLSGGRSRGTAAVAWMQIARHTRPFSLIPDIARRKKSRLAPRSRKLSYFVRGCVEQGDTRFAKGVPLHIDNLAAGRRSLRAYPRNEWKHQRLVSVAPNLNALSVPKVETSDRPDRHCRKCSR